MKNIMRIFKAKTGFKIMSCGISQNLKPQIF